MKKSIAFILLLLVCSIAIIFYCTTKSVHWLPMVSIGLLVLFAILFIFLLKISSAPKILSESSDLTEKLNKLQAQLLEQDKMASIGMLTAGISHEIKNPLNFINNFSEMTVEMLSELKSDIAKLPESTPSDVIDNISSIVEDISQNCQKINEHGKRAESIIRNMLIQSRSVEGEKTPCNINALLDEYLNLAFHAMRAQNSRLNIKIEKNYDSTLPTITASPQSMGRVFLNIINNGMYAANEKAEKLNLPHTEFMPTITITTAQDQEYIIIKIRDNGTGIPDELKQKIFEPFFTTKPSGKGTGLGLPICYDIVVKEHHGTLDIESAPNEFTEFILKLPKNNVK